MDLLPGTYEGVLARWFIMDSLVVPVFALPLSENPAVFEIRLLDFTRTHHT